MLAAYMIGLLPEGEAFYTDSAKPLEEQKVDTFEWPLRDDLASVHAVVGGTITDITAAWCRMWINRADLSDFDRAEDFPRIIRDHVPELIDEVMRNRRENERAQRQLASDYRASRL